MAEAATCADLEGWVSSTGFGCAEYGSENWCTSDGGFGEGWQQELGAFADWGVDGVDATMACCVCGGGDSRRRARKLRGGKQH